MLPVGYSDQSFNPVGFRASGGPGSGGFTFPKEMFEADTFELKDELRPAAADKPVASGDAAAGDVPVGALVHPCVDDGTCGPVIDRYKKGMNEMSAATGAAVGEKIGSVAGPVGSFAGGIIGGIIGGALGVFW